MGESFQHRVANKCSFRLGVMKEWKVLAQTETEKKKKTERKRVLHQFPKLTEIVRHLWALRQQILWVMTSMISVSSHPIRSHYSIYTVYYIYIYRSCHMYMTVCMLSFMFRSCLENQIIVQFSTDPKYQSYSTCFALFHENGSFVLQRKVALLHEQSLDSLPSF